MRPKRDRRLPKRFDDYNIEINCLALLSDFSETPRSYSEAKQSGDSDLWNKAIEEELNALKENKTWELVDRPINQEVNTNRWVFRIKEDDEAKFVYKARLVARGFEQTFEEISQIHAPVCLTVYIKSIIINMLLL